MKTLSIIIPAHNEAALIGACLTAALASEPLGGDWQVECFVVANGCTDTTAAVARGHQLAARTRGWALSVIEVAKGGKLNALNVGDAQASGDVLVYLDADVTVKPALLKQLCEALDTGTARYASGAPQVSPARSWITRLYARFWSVLPFVTTGTPGFGVFAMNAPGRGRWGHWPDIISDDTFARLNFTAAERVRVEAGYHWPMVEGFANLVRVRRRQNDGVSEIARLFPDLLANDDRRDMSLSGLLRRAMRDPLGFAAYVTIALAVKSSLFQSDSRWARGR